MDNHVLIYGITDQSALERFIRNQSLVEKEQSLEGTSSWVSRDALYFGVGLSNGVPFLTQGLPIDVLSMLLVSEMLADRKYILIADSHAKANGFADAEIHQIAEHYKTTLETTIANLGLQGWSVLFASALETESRYQHALWCFSELPPYAQRQLADMVWFQQERGVSLKVGWALTGDRRKDEVYFDRLYKAQVEGFVTEKDPLSFLYVVSGKTFDPKKPHCAPYFCADKHARVLLEKDEDVTTKILQAQNRFGPAQKKECLNYLKALVRLYDTCIAPTERGSVEQKLQEVITRCFP